MRGTTTRQAAMLSTLASDSLIPFDHPIRRIKPVVEAVLAPEFDAIYARPGRQSVPPEHLLKATLLMALHSNPQRAPVLRAAPLRPALQVSSSTSTSTTRVLTTAASAATGSGC